MISSYFYLKIYCFWYCTTTKWKILIESLAIRPNSLLIIYFLRQYQFTSHAHLPQHRSIKKLESPPRWIEHRFALLTCQLCLCTMSTTLQNVPHCLQNFVLIDFPTHYYLSLRCHTHQTFYVLLFELLLVILYISILCVHFFYSLLHLLLTIFCVYLLVYVVNLLLDSWIQHDYLLILLGSQTSGRQLLRHQLGYSNHDGVELLPDSFKDFQNLVFAGRLLLVDYIIPKSPSADSQQTQSPHPDSFS